MLTPATYTEQNVHCAVLLCLRFFFFQLSLCNLILLPIKICCSVSLVLSLFVHPGGCSQTPTQTPRRPLWSWTKTTYAVGGRPRWSYKPKTSMEMWCTSLTWRSGDCFGIQEINLIYWFLFFVAGVVMPFDKCFSSLCMSRWRWRPFPFHKRSRCNRRMWRGCSGSLGAPRRRPPDPT